MNLNKAIRKQNASVNRFVFSMCLIFFSLPVALVFSHQFNIFLILYLVIIELLIVLVVLGRLNRDTLNFKDDGYRLKVKDGVVKVTSNVIYDKINVVHVENINNDFRIILITKTKFRNKYLKKIDEGFMRRYPSAGRHYTRIKQMYPENNYFYLVFRNGGLKKYLLLDELFKKCVQANFTDEAIDKLKETRGI